MSKEVEETDDDAIFTLEIKMGKDGKIGIGLICPDEETLTAINAIQMDIKKSVIEMVRAIGVTIQQYQARKRMGLEEATP